MQRDAIESTHCINETAYRVTAPGFAAFGDGLDDFLPRMLIVDLSDDQVMADHDERHSSNSRQANVFVDLAKQDGIGKAPVDFKFAKSQAWFVGLQSLQEPAGTYGIGRIRRPEKIHGWLGFRCMRRQRQYR